MSKLLDSRRCLFPFKIYKNSEIVLVDALCVARYFENTIITVYCNPVVNVIFQKYKATLIGHSQITTPFMGAIKKLEHNKMKMFIQEVDTDILIDAEKAYKIRNDIKNRVLY